MPLRVLIVPDKFKGTLTAAEAAEAIARGWRRARPEDSLDLLPMSDGGDGFGEILSGLLHAVPQTVPTVDAAHRPCEATWWRQEGVSIAVVESAKAIGLAQLPRGKYHPFELDTEGLGALLLDATRAGMQRCLMGIGGSATNDGGFGLARALGWQFFNKHGQRILRWTELHQLSQVRPPEQRRLFRELIVAVDVQNPLLGPEGCTRVYGPQKGLCAEDFEFAERCLECMASVLSKELHLSCASEPGTGAAGGLGYGLRCFAGGTLQPGFDVFSRHAKLTDCVQAAELVLTGEGAIDSSTLMGKGVGQVASLCRQLGVPCIGLAGAVPQATEGMNLFRQTHALVPAFASLEEAMAQPRACLERLAAKVAGELRPGQLGPAAPGTP